MTAHTPGEWFAEPDPYSCDGDWRIGVGDHVQCVATCSRRDAPLLTAAPDLLAALAALVSACAEDGWPVKSEHMMPLAIARAALAKARP